MSAGSVADGKGSKSSYLARRSKIVSFSFILTVIQLVYLSQATLMLKRAVRETRKWIMTMYKQCHV